MVTGSIRKFSYGNVPFNVAADNDPNLKPSVETTMTRTSGGSVPSQELKNPDIEGISIDVSNHEDYETLKGFAEAGTPQSASLTLASGQTLSSGSAYLSIDDKSLMKGFVEINVMPETDWLLG